MGGLCTVVHSNIRMGKVAKRLQASTHHSCSQRKLTHSSSQSNVACLGAGAGGVYLLPVCAARALCLHVGKVISVLDHVAICLGRGFLHIDLQHLRLSWCPLSGCAVACVMCLCVVCGMALQVAKAARSYFAAQEPQLQWLQEVQLPDPAADVPLSESEAGLWIGAAASTELVWLHFALHKHYHATK